MNSTARSRGAVDAHQRSVRLEWAQIVQFLRENLGPTLVAIIADVDARTVSRWAHGEQPRKPSVERRLRETYRVFQLLQTVESPPTVRAWFMGMNPQLDDDSPAEALAGERYRDVIAAANAFVSGG